MQNRTGGAARSAELRVGRAEGRRCRLSTPSNPKLLLSSEIASKQTLALDFPRPARRRSQEKPFGLQRRFGCVVGLKRQSVPGLHTCVRSETLSAEEARRVTQPLPQQTLKLEAKARVLRQRARSKTASNPTTTSSELSKASSKVTQHRQQPLSRPAGLPRQNSLKMLLDSYARLRSGATGPHQRDQLLRMRDKLREVFKFLDQRLSRMEQKQQPNVNAVLRRRREMAAVVIQKHVRGVLTRKFYREMRVQRARRMRRSLGVQASCSRESFQSRAAEPGQDGARALSRSALGEREGWSQLFQLVKQTEQLWAVKRRAEEEVQSKLSQISAITKKQKRIWAQPRPSAPGSPAAGLSRERTAKLSPDVRDVLVVALPPAPAAGVHRHLPKGGLDIWPQTGGERGSANVSFVLENKSSHCDSERKFFLTERDVKLDNSSLSLEKKAVSPSPFAKVRPPSPPRELPLAPEGCEVVEIPLHFEAADGAFEALVEELVREEPWARLLSARRADEEEVIYGIRTNINAVNEYCNLLIKYIEDCFLVGLAQCMRSALIRGPTRGGAGEGQGRWRPNGRSRALLAPTVYAELEEKILDSYRDARISPLLFDLQRTYHRAVFDCYNETLTALFFTPRPGELSAEERGRIWRADPDVQFFLYKAKSVLLESSLMMCGLMQEKEDSLMDPGLKGLDPLSLQIVHEERLFKLVSALIAQEQQQPLRAFDRAHVCKRSSEISTEIEDLLLEDTLSSFPTLAR